MNSAPVQFIDAYSMPLCCSQCLFMLLCNLCFMAPINHRSGLWKSGAKHGNEGMRSFSLKIYRAHIFLPLITDNVQRGLC